MSGRTRRDARLGLRAQFVELGAQALEVDVLRRRADAILREAIPYTVGAWATVDPASLLFTRSSAKSRTGTRSAAGVSVSF